MISEEADRVLHHMAAVFGPGAFVGAIERIALYNDEPRIWMFSNILGRGFEKKTENYFSGGGSFQLPVGVIRAIGEGIERFCIFERHRYIQYVRSSFAKLGSRALDIGACESHFSDRPLVIAGRIEKHRNTTLQWVVGHSLITGKKIYVPAQLVFFGKHDRGEEPLFPTGSSGAAAGPSRQFAQLEGALEMIERDAFLVSYFSNISPRLIDMQTTPESIQALNRRIKRYNLELHVVDLFTDLPLYAIGVIVFDRTGIGPAIALGLGAGFDLEETILGAIDEAIFTRASFRFSDSKRALEKAQWLRQHPTRIKNMHDRRLYWNDVSMIKHILFLAQGPRISYQTLQRRFRKIPHTVSARLETLIRALKSSNKDFISVDVTHPGMAREGFFAAKVFLPQLQHLYFDEAQTVINEHRIAEVLAHNGFLQPLTINRMPHPFL